MLVMLPVMVQHVHQQLSVLASPSQNVLIPTTMVATMLVMLPVMVQHVEHYETAPQQDVLIPMEMGFMMNVSRMEIDQIVPI